jgi:hypothetical protein
MDLRCDTGCAATAYPAEKITNVRGAADWTNARDPEERYNFLDASYSGQGGYASGRYLIPHYREDASRFALRKAKSRIINDFRPIIDGWISPIFGREVSFSISEDLTDAQKEAVQLFLDDCDGAGTSFRAWMKQFARASRKYDSAFAMVNAPENGAVSVADLSDRSKLPFLMQFTPSKVKEVKLSQLGEVLEFSWVSLDPKAVENCAAKKINEKPMYKITPKSWGLYGSDSGKIVEEAENDFGFVPVVPLYPEENDDYIDDPFPYGLAYTLATIQHRRYNLASIADEITDGQGFSILCIAGVTQSDIEIGVSNALTGLDANAPMPAYISPDANQLKTILEELAQMTEEMYRVGNMPHLRSFAQSAEAKKLDTERTREALGDFAFQIERAEERILQMVGLYMGFEIDYKVSYSRSWDDMSIQDLTDMISTLSTSQTAPALLAELEVLIARQVFRDRDADESERIFEEIRDHRNNLETASFAAGANAANLDNLV